MTLGPSWAIGQCFTIVLEKNIQKEQSISERAKEIIEKNYDKKISLNTIAEMMHLHKVYLSRVFKEESGENIVQYIMDIKLEKAKQILVTTQLTIQDISHALGFKTPQYFSIVFKKYTGKSPGEYRKARIESEYK